MKQKRSLTEQLLYLSIIIISIVVISLGIILPKTLLPIYEENLYNYLKQPLSYIEESNGGDSSSSSGGKSVFNVNVNTTVKSSYLLIW